MCGCGADQPIVPPPVDGRRVHGAGERVRRGEERVGGAAARLLGGAGGRGTDRGLRALALPPHPPPPHRYSQRAHAHPMDEFVE